MQEVHKYLLGDSRIDVLMLPLFDGVIQIKWKTGYLETQKGVS